MNQPDLGIKVSELRQQRGFTQEQLAEKCEVSTRTIQRIESGEVDPRAFTLNRLGEVLEFDFEEPNLANENIWLVVLNLSSMFVILIIPLLLWSWKKKQSIKMAQQGRQVLNFQITMTLVLFAAAFLLMLAPVALVFFGRSRCKRCGRQSHLHAARHVHSIAAHPHWHLLHLSGRDQCHACAVRQTHSLPPQYRVYEVNQCT